MQGDTPSAYVDTRMYMCTPGDKKYTEIYVYINIYVCKCRYIFKYLYTYVYTHLYAYISCLL